MKKPKQILIAFFCISLFLVGHYHASYPSADDALSFNRLYPENWYVKAREYCIHAWSALDEIVHREQNDRPSESSLIDISMGKLVFAYNAVSRMLESKMPLLKENVVYLSRLVGTLVQRGAQLSKSVAKDQIECLTSMIEKLRKKVILLLSVSET